MSVFGWRNPREQIGYITMSLLAHCVLDGKMLDVVRDSLCTLIDPAYIGKMECRDLAFQQYQELDVLTRTLEEQGLTVTELLGLFTAGKAGPFFTALAKQAVKDANFRDCRVPPCVRVHPRTMTGGQR